MKYFYIYRLIRFIAEMVKCTTALKGIPDADGAQTWSDSGEPAMFSAACRRARLALISPSATITCEIIINKRVKLNTILALAPL